MSEDGLDEPYTQSGAAMTNTSASQAKRARSVTTRANPACAPDGEYNPNTSEFAIARSTISLATPGDQYAVRRKRQIAWRSRRAGPAP